MKLIKSILILLFFMGTSVSYADSNLYSRALNEMSNLPKDSLINAKQAISSRNELKVAFVGDSITEGIDNADPSDAYVAKVIELLKDSLPNVNILSQNFGLAGSFTGLFNLTNFKGVTTPTSDPNAGFLRSWSVVGKSWQDTVRDYNPDLVIVAFGMNDASANYSYSDDWSSGELNKLIDTVQSWPSHPSIVIVPTILPTLDLTKYPQRQDVTESVARAHRAVAKERKLAIADVNRLFSILRDGKDSVSTATYAETNWLNYNINWVGNISYFTPSGNKLTPNDGASSRVIYRDKNFYNGVIDFDVTPSVAGDSGTTWIHYRNSDLGDMTLVIGGGIAGYVRLYSFDPTSSYTYIAESNNLNIPIGIATHIKIEAKDNQHIIIVGSTKVIDVKTYKTMNTGKFGIGMNLYPSTISNLSIKFKDPLVTAPQLSELEALGAVGSPNGGNGMNHPSTLGTEIFYVPSFYGIIKELSR